MQTFLVSWMIQLEAESAEEAALAAADMLPSAECKSTATSFAVIDDEEVAQSILSHNVTHLDLAKYFEWLKEQKEQKEQNEARK